MNGFTIFQERERKLNYNAAFVGDAIVIPKPTYNNVESI